MSEHFTRGKSLVVLRSKTKKKKSVMSSSFYKRSKWKFLGNRKKKKRHFEY